MGSLLTYEEFKFMRKLGKIAASLLRRLKYKIKPGISTKDIEVFLEEEIKKYPHLEAAFKGFSGYPSSCCVSVNECVIHGIPSKEKTIRKGDIVSVDLGLQSKGLFVDTAYSYPVGRVSSLGRKLLKVSLMALREGIKMARPGKKIGDIGYAIQKTVHKYNFSVIKKFVGHGIGKSLHLPPEVPNFGIAGEGEILREGMALAIEPMISSGGDDVEVLSDGWSVKTKDNSLSAHFEHTVAITKRGPWVLTN